MILGDLWQTFAKQPFKWVSRWGNESIWLINWDAAFMGFDKVIIRGRTTTSTIWSRSTSTLLINHIHFVRFPPHGNHNEAEPLF